MMETKNTDIVAVTLAALINEVMDLKARRKYPQATDDEIKFLRKSEEKSFFEKYLQGHVSQPDAEAPE